MNINQKLRALGFDPSNHDAAVHSALDELIERVNRSECPCGHPADEWCADGKAVHNYESRDAATCVKSWWDHVKNCDVCILARPYCAIGAPIYGAARVRHTPRRVEIQVRHRDFILRRAQ